MARRRVDNFSLERWRSLDAVVVLRAFADHLKQDTEFMPRQSHDSTRWYASVGGFDYELLCTGPKFFDPHAERGGGGAVDLVMHLFNLDFKHAVALLGNKGL